MNRSESALALISIGLLIILFVPYAATAAPTVYRVYVDEWYGFYRVIENNYTPLKYENQTLNLNAGDTVIWINDASDNSDMTIVSAQNLWDNNSAYLQYNDRSFNYTFNKPGTYEVYMKENPRRPHQTIIVAGVETPAVTTPSPTPTPTETITVAPSVTPSVTQTPQEKAPEFNLWYILLALILVVVIAVLFYNLKKK